MLQIKFHGAAGTVTGSNYLVSTDKYKFIVDCGMFQGPGVESRNLEDFEYDPSEVDFVILTHAHIDHSGLLPKLVRNGFHGPIFATGHTVQIASMLLLDSAKIQENNFQSGKPYGKFTGKVAIVYHSKDAEDTINMFQAKNFMDEFEPVDGITLKFLRAGHILGAASVEVKIKDEDKMILFSGDIGRRKGTLIETFDTEYRSEPDYVLIESLYGGVLHPDRNESTQELIQIIDETIKSGGGAYIPSFAVERTQEILNLLKIAKQSGALEESIPVYFDSPLAQRVTNIYREALQHGEDDLFNFKNLMYVKKYRQSQKIHNRSGQIVLAGSGMAEGGRIVDHLAAALPNKKHSIIFVGYQAEGTLGRALVDGEKVVKIGNTSIQVKAKIHYLHGFSAHGDNSDYLSFIERHISPKLKKVFLVHSEPDRAKGLDNSLDSVGITDDKTYTPVWKETVKLD